MLCGANSVFTRQEYAALQRDERVPEKQKYASTEPKEISSEAEPVTKLSVSESKITEIKLSALEAEEECMFFSSIHFYLKKKKKKVSKSKK